MTDTSWLPQAARLHARNRPTSPAGRGERPQSSNICGQAATISIIVIMISIRFICISMCLVSDSMLTLLMMHAVKFSAKPFRLNLYRVRLSFRRFALLLELHPLHTRT